MNNEFNEESSFAAFLNNPSTKKPIAYTAEIVLHYVFSIDGDARAIGYIFNDSKQRFKDGEKIRTSQVLNLDTFEIDGYITTQNSIYKIREPIK
ncbi:hypothetical protein KKJ04_20230 [Xenorhabdus bovienii]|uniref:hypothetical protein n=1 Tax=Xenorhabdus bovienii TaxID=40576 RepID=UPI0023B35331|nr:hypothetical protein [Xenorhabdus bovienii]MDE9447809.1 hypothetical protein [Xenorhabdus bovienii]